MKQWKTTMPREKPSAGKVHFLMSSKSVGRSRAELFGEISETKARLMWELAQMSDEEISDIGIERLMPSNAKLTGEAGGDL